MRQAGIIALIAATALAAACGHGDPHADILLFNGTGVSRNDVRAFEDLLDERGLRYDLKDSRGLDALDAGQLRGYRLLIIPGGNFEDMGNHLAPATSANVRRAVNDGMNYLGVCAGAFMAGDSPYNGINLTGVRFRFYAISAQGVRKSAVPVSTPDGQTLEHYWEDGPELSGWGTAIASYPDGTPAVVQGPVGKGWVVLAGTHPEAPDNWRDGMNFTTPARGANEYAMRLIDGALHARPEAAVRP